MLEVRYIYHFDNKPVNEYTLKNGRFQISILNLGAAITKIIVPNQHDKLENITLRYHDYKLYIDNKYNLGCLIDIDKFINNEDYVLNYYFDCEVLENALKFTYSKDDNYISVIYTLNDYELLIEYQNNLQVNLGHIIFFNLSGNVKENINNHLLKYNEKLVNLNEGIEYFSPLTNKEDRGKIFLVLPENGINLSIDILNPIVYYSLGKYFNQEFYINKRKLAKEHLGIGLLLNGNIRISFNR